MAQDTLAIFGGPKAVDYPHPHWQWPPKSAARTASVVDALENPRDNDKGYPEIVEKFERAFADYNDMKFAIGMNAGTSTLFSAFFAVGLEPGDEIIAPTMTFIATATPLARIGARPVFADCEPDTGNIDPADIEHRITSKTKAIVITHLCGHPCEMDEICRIAKKHGLALIEDCSHAHGSMYKARMVGTFGDISCFSLGRKILTSGEAGILLTNDRRLYERALLVSDFGPRVESEMTLPETSRFSETGLGLKCRMHPLSAAILMHELAELDTYISCRKDRLDYFSNGIENLPGLAPPVTRDHATRGGYYSYRPFYYKEALKNISILEFMKLLHNEGVEIRRSNNPPLHLMALFNDYWPDTKQPSLPNSEVFFGTTLSLPTFTMEDYSFIDMYVDAFRKVSTYLAYSNDSINVVRDALTNAPDGPQ